MDGAAILAFPSFEDAKRWYHSPAYQNAASHRFVGRTTAFLSLDENQ